MQRRAIGGGVVIGIVAYSRYGKLRADELLQPGPLSSYDVPQATGVAMKKRAKAGAEPLKGRRRKTPKPERPHAPKAVARTNSPPAAEETEVARLIRERDEALEQQTATSEVLQAISSSTGDLEPVFGTILEKAVRYCDANFGTFFLYEKNQTSLVAAHNMPTAFSEAHRRRPGTVPGGPVETAMRTRRAVHIPDLQQRNPTVNANPERLTQ
jgi:two-component system, NtrC family, sensor kinase